MSLTVAPLDIFLMRAHALPLPYVTVPSLSFLVYISPQAYLTMLRASSATAPIARNPLLPQLDVPFSELRSCVGAHPRKQGITMASLSLSAGGPRLPPKPDDMSMTPDRRPSFPLVQPTSNIRQQFPLANVTEACPDGDGRYFLDFTDEGRYPGVVISQTRMCEIEMLLHPLAGFDALNIPSMILGSRNWVDMLVCHFDLNRQFHRAHSSRVKP